jgi:hypothetical protein
MDTSKNNSQEPLDGAFVDSAVSTALGTESPEVSEAFAAGLAGADEGHRRVARQLRETVAKMSAASPYMEPSDALRGRILAATAPATFKMEDYRRVENGGVKWLRWGMVAAVAFLTWSAYTNTSLRREISQNRATIAELNDRGMKLQNQANQDIASLRDQVINNSMAMNALTDDNVKRVSLVNEKHEKIGLLLQDPNTGRILVVMPQTVLPRNAIVQLTIQQGDTRQQITGLAVGAPGNQSGLGLILKSPLDQNKPVQLDISAEGAVPVRAGSGF